MDAITNAVISNDLLFNCNPPKSASPHHLLSFQHHRPPPRHQQQHLLQRASSCQSDDYISQYINISDDQKTIYIINHLLQRASSCQLPCTASSPPLPSPSHSPGSSLLPLFLARETTFLETCGAKNIICYYRDGWKWFWQNTVIMY